MEGPSNAMGEASQSMTDGVRFIYTKKKVKKLVLQVLFTQELDTHKG